MNPISFVFQIIQDWLSPDPDQNAILISSAMEDYEKSKLATFFQRFPYLLILFPILAPIARTYFNKFMHKIILDADGDGDRDLNDAAIQIMEALAKRRPNSPMAQKLRKLQTFDENE